MSGGVSGGSGARGGATSAGGTASRAPLVQKVTSPSGQHAVLSGGDAAARQPFYTPTRGTHEVGRSGVAPAQRAGVFGVTAVRTALFRQTRPLPARTFGMVPVVNVRRTPPLR